MRIRANRCVCAACLVALGVVAAAEQPTYPSTSKIAHVDKGSSDDADEFAALKAYSPLHNISKGVKYPATLVTTADHDDRLVPAHSFKYAATLQELARHENPLLIRIETHSAHGASGLEKQLETIADIYSFILYNMGLKPVFPGSQTITSTGN
jgi:protease II